MAEDEEANAEGEEGGGKKGGMMLYIIIGVVVLTIGAVAAIFLLGGEEEKKKDGAQQEEIDVAYETAALDPIIVNLSQNTRFLKAKILVEYDPSLVYPDGRVPPSASGAERMPDDPLPGLLGQREPMIKDAIIRLLASKTVEDVLSVEGKDTLKEELIEAINEASGSEEGAVSQIYFVEFIVQ